jgi:hypothetical protein
LLLGDLKLTRHEVRDALFTRRTQTRADRRWWSIIGAQETGTEVYRSGAGKQPERPT